MHGEELSRAAVGPLLNSDCLFIFSPGLQRRPSPKCSSSTPSVGEGFSSLDSIKKSEDKSLNRGRTGAAANSKFC